MRILIVGNSGSGKSTYAAMLSAKHGIPHLELDSIVWEPRKIAILRPTDEIECDLHAFTSANQDWVIEGCYGDLTQRLLGTCTELVFMNPGKETCLRNNRNRPWEPHKYGSEAEQQQMLSNLLEWVADYYDRQGASSYAYHRDLFDNCTAPKCEFSCLPSA